MVVKFTKLSLNSFFKEKKEISLRLLFVFLISIISPLSGYSFQSDEGYNVGGVVVSKEDGNGIPGVAISLKGTTKGTITDVDGRFRIMVPSAETVLVFSFLGFEKQEIRVDNQTDFRVELEGTESELEEVVVVAYGEQKKFSVTGAISSVSSDELSRSPSPNVANSLAGKVTGLSTVQFSGQPGADDPTIFVRGVASLSEGRSQPLMIVDGVERSFMQLDPEEIESISILKDASATAVYGVRGANGVIIVNTKRGKKGAAKITASFSTGIQQPTRLLDFVGSHTYASRFNEAQLNDNPDLTEEQLKFSPEALEAFRTGSDPLIYPDMNWMDYILKPNARQDKSNVNISGGTDKVRYFVSLGYLNQEGLFNTFDSQYDYNFGFKRYNYRGNVDIDVTKTTTVGVTVGGRANVTNQPNGNIGEMFRDIYWSVPFSGAGIVDDKYILSSDFYMVDEKKDALRPFYGQGFTNSLNNTLNFDINLVQKLDFITKGLMFRTKGAYNTSYSHSKVRNSSVPYYEPFYRKDVDPSADSDDRDVVFRKIGAEGNLGYNENFGKARNYYFEAGVNYNRKFGVHNVGSLVLYNQNKFYYPSQFRDIAAGLVGLVGRITYDFKSKYFVDFNIGYNGSENFAEDKRFGVFPAFSGGWILTQEPFMEQLRIFDFLKVRASYGLVGNDKLGGNRFLYLPDRFNPIQGGYNFGTDNPNNRIIAREGQIGNPDVTWETAKKQNYGVEMEFLRGKLGFNFDYFREHRNDILTFRGTVPAFVAYDLPAVNIGEVENKGFEAEIKWNHSYQPKFRYWINLNVSRSRNKILFMDEVPQPEDYLYRTGHPVSQPFGYIFDKFYDDRDENNDNIPDHQYNLQPGDMVYKDLNGDGVVNQNDQRAIGNPVYPGYTFGANLGFQLGNFDLSMSWVGATNTSRMLAETYRVAFGNTGNRSLLQYMADGRWTPENSDQATYPRMTLTGRNNNSKNSDFWLRDASYIRLKNLEAGYNFKGDFLKTIGMSTVRLFANGFNLLTFDKLKITDPESRTGADSAYPLTKIYNLGVKANF